MEKSWRVDAACLEYDPDIFFPDESVDTKERYDWKVNYSKGVCKECSVTKECLKLGLEDANIRFGIFGGMTPQERVKKSGRKVYMYNGVRGKQ